MERKQGSKRILRHVIQALLIASLIVTAPLVLGLSLGHVTDFLASSRNAWSTTAMQETPSLLDNQLQGDNIQDENLPEGSQLAFPQSPTWTTPPWERFSPAPTVETTPGARLGYWYEVEKTGDLGNVHFAMPDTYSPHGITTFRGNNFRSGGTWGTANIVDGQLSYRYHLGTGAIGGWAGVGWTGQPAIVQWDSAILRQMNVFSETVIGAGEDGLVEVIYGTLDGYIYFFHLYSGERTRPPINFGAPIKGAVTVDPRGYPLLYVGQGDANGSRFGFAIYSLIDGAELFFLDGFDPFANRRWAAFDANPLIDGDNDRLILSGENGVLYSIALGTNFDQTAGTISIEPEISARFRYGTTPERRLGFEASIAGLGQYIFLSDNSGLLKCIDATTFSPVWVQDLGDDADASVLLDWEEEHERLVIYTGTQVDLQGPGGVATIYKIDASDGSVLWYHEFPCRFDAAVNGGVMATPLLGQGDIGNLVIFTIAKTLDVGGDGLILALDRQTGEIVWQKVMRHYAWSSPVALYTESGKSYIIQTDSTGMVYLLEGTTGQVLDQLQIQGTTESTPAVWGNTLVFGTRWSRLYALDVQ